MGEVTHDVMIGQVMAEEDEARLGHVSPGAFGAVVMTGQVVAPSTDDVMAGQVTGEVT